MFCSKCGTANPDVAKHCMNCGQPLITEAMQPQVPIETPVAPVQPQAPAETPAAPVQPQAPVETPVVPVQPQAPVETPVVPVQPQAPAETPVVPVQPQASVVPQPQPMVMNPQVAPQPQPMMTPPPMMNQQMMNQQMMAGAQAGMQPEKKKSKKGLVIGLIIGIVVLLAAIACILIFVVFAKKRKDSEKVVDKFAAAVEDLKYDELFDYVAPFAVKDLDSDDKDAIIDDLMANPLMQTKELSIEVGDVEYVSDSKYNELADEIEGKYENVTVADAATVEMTFEGANKTVDATVIRVGEDWYIYQVEDFFEIKASFGDPAEVVERMFSSLLNGDVNGMLNCAAPYIRDSVNAQGTLDEIVESLELFESMGVEFSYNVGEATIQENTGIEDMIMAQYNTKVDAVAFVELELRLYGNLYGESYDESESFDVTVISINGEWFIYDMGGAF